jgi:hypothetical protein
MYGGTSRSPTGRQMTGKVLLPDEEQDEDGLQTVEEMFLFDEAKKPSTVVAVMGDICPIGKDKAIVLRKIAKAATKLYVVDTGEGELSDAANDELFAMTFPDLEDKAKLVHADGYDVVALKRAAGEGVAVNLLVPQDVDLLGPTDGLNVERSDELQRFSSRELADAIKSADIEAVKRLVDPHAVTDEERLKGLFEPLGEAVNGMSAGVVAGNHSLSHSPWSSGKRVRIGRARGSKWDEAGDALDAYGAGGPIDPSNDPAEDDPIDSDRREGLSKPTLDKPALR